MEDIEKLEQYRQKIANKIKVSIIIFILIVLLALSLPGQVNPFITVAVGLGGIFLYIYLITKDFNSIFKDKIVRKIIYELEPNLVYEPKSHMNLNDFNYSKIYQKPDRFRGNDLVYGQVDGVDIKFSDMTLINSVSSTDIDGESTTDDEISFQGIFFMADFHKKFSSKTYVLSNKPGFTLGNIKKAYMDNSLFEKKFKTYTDDQISARYILTPKLMEQILKVREVLDCPVNIAFLDSQIYIYIEFNKDSFEPNISHTLIGENSIIAQYKKDISIIISLVKELNLSTRIWAG